MKKIFLSLGIILSLGLVGCGNKQNAEKIAEQEAKIEELKKKVSTIESDTVESASEEITPLTDDEKKEIINKFVLDTNKEIASSFINAGLPIYDAEKKGPGQYPAVSDDPNGWPDTQGSITFFLENGLVMETTTLNNHEGIQDFINLHEVNYPIEYVINDKINSILFTETNALTLQSKELFNEYAKVFEAIE